MNWWALGEYPVAGDFFLCRFRLGLDVRNRDFAATSVIELIDRLTRRPDFAPEVLYLDCAADVLVRRYNETRRRHPLATSEVSLLDAIRLERKLLKPVADLAAALAARGLPPESFRAAEFGVAAAVPPASPSSPCPP